MPQSNDSELWREVRAVKDWMARHDGECSVRNQEIAEWRKEIAGDVAILKRDRAKVIGVLIGVAAAGSAAGTGGVVAILKAVGAL